MDPENKGCLGYDEFYKSLCKLVKVTHPETYVIYKNCMENGCLSMKQLFRALGGS